MSIVITRRGMAVAATAGALLLAALAAAPAADAQTLYACVKKDGSAHVYTKKPKCKKHETKLSWGTAGQSGSNGVNGAQGLRGATGATGSGGSRGATGPAGPFPGTLPTGITLRGAYDIGGTAAGALTLALSDISFGFEFASAPVFHFIETLGASTPECPGTVEKPQAAPGNVCVYNSAGVNAEAVQSNLPATFGTTLFFKSVAAGEFFNIGTWAATSP
jgi:hypothetical protein